MKAARAIILAAGRGSRLGAVGVPRAKCLQRLAGRTLLDWQIAALRAAGIDDIVVVTGYGGEVIAARADVRALRNDDWRTSGPIASLLCAQDCIENRAFIVVYGDCPFHPDLLRSLQRIGAPIGMTCDLDWLALWSARFDDVLADAERLRRKHRRLLAIGGRAQTLDEIEGQFTGLVKFDAAGWRATRRALAALTPKAVRGLDMTGLLARLLACGTHIGIAPIRGRWCEIDSAADLLLYRRLLRRRAWTHDWRWRDAWA